ncbi:hypothetical protein JKP88DRAFT_266429 [Tribonema minus]|uniref:SWIM-type domain-containing protein n=1 Tax=Tribonema minus TaxID=303371 RepID=A0A835ZI37_9STRA|nr:hypothetical protein JKP88DRAFT_266429 [Tribonema minus]
MRSSRQSVVVAASGAALCSCLETPRTGMLCRHIIACMLQLTVIADSSGGGCETVTVSNRDKSSSRGAETSEADDSSAAPGEAPASCAFDVPLQIENGGGLGVIFAFADRAVTVEAFTRHKTTGAVLPAEACGDIAVGDVITAIDGCNLRRLSAEKAKAVLGDALSKSPTQSTLTVRSAGGSNLLLRAREPVVSTDMAGGLAGAQSTPQTGGTRCRTSVPRSTAVAVFRNTHPRWMRPSTAAAASCITSSAGEPYVLAQVVAQAAQR